MGVSPTPVQPVGEQTREQRLEAVKAAISKVLSMDACTVQLISEEMMYTFSPGYVTGVVMDTAMRTIAQAAKS